jgi:hypothetical protein
MSSLDAVTAWVENYRRAWESNDPEQIGGLFAEDGAYFTEPFAKPWLGRDEIVAKWLERKDEPGSTTFAWTTLADHDGLAFVQGETDYGSITYSNLWVIRLWLLPMRPMCPGRASSPQPPGSPQLPSSRSGGWTSPNPRDLCGARPFWVCRIRPRRS